MNKKSRAETIPGYINEVLSALWRAVKAVIKTQLILSGVTFIILCVGFVIIDIPLWGLKALAISVVDLIPIIGSGIVMLPWAMVLFVMGNKTTAIGLMITYLVLFVTRQILEPVLNGKNIGVKPLYTLISTTIFSILLGPWGLLAGPAAAIVIKTIFDIRERRQG